MCGTDSPSQNHIINQMLLNMIVRDVQPVPVVEDSGFKDFVGDFDCKYDLPSHRTIMQNMLHEVYRGETLLG